MRKSLCNFLPPALCHRLQAVIWPALVLLSCSSFSLSVSVFILSFSIYHTPFHLHPNLSLSFKTSCLTLTLSLLLFHLFSPSTCPNTTSLSLSLSLSLPLWFCQAGFKQQLLSSVGRWQQSQQSQQEAAQLKQDAVIKSGTGVLMLLLSRSAFLRSLKHTACVCVHVKVSVLK